MDGDLGRYLAFCVFPLLMIGVSITLGLIYLALRTDLKPEETQGTRKMTTERHEPTPSRTMSIRGSGA